MKVCKILILVLCQVIASSAYDSLVEHESYFKKAIEKSKVNNFGKNRIIAVLDSGINENFELRGKVVAEYAKNYYRGIYNVV